MDERNIDRTSVSPTLVKDIKVLQLNCMKDDEISIIPGTFKSLRVSFSSPLFLIQYEGIRVYEHIYKFHILSFIGPLCCTICHTNVSCNA